MMDVKTQAIVNLLAAQRNEALNALAQTVGEIAERDERIKVLEEKLKANGEES